MIGEMDVKVIEEMDVKVIEEMDVKVIEEMATVEILRDLPNPDLTNRLSLKWTEYTLRPLRWLYSQGRQDRAPEV